MVCKNYPLAKVLEMSSFTYKQKIIFQHCDPAGIVFYPRYLEMVSATVEEWFSSCVGIEYSKIHSELNMAVPTATIDITFRAPSRLGEYIDIILVPERIGTSSLHFKIEAICNDEQRFVSKMIVVFAKHGAGKSTPWPNDFRKRIENTMR